MARNLGPGPIHRSETESSAAPVAAKGGRDFGASNLARPLAGLATVVAIALVVALAIGAFAGGYATTVPVTVISQRAGLVMNPDAKVKLRGVEVGKVDSIEQRPDGTAALHLAMDPSRLRFIPANVHAQIASTTVFGAKYVQLDAPPDRSAATLRAGQVIQGDHVTVEMNTVFQQLTDVLDTIDPVKLNQALGAIATAFNGRGAKIGQTLTDFNSLLAKLEPSLPALSHDIEASTPMLNAYADAAPNLVQMVDNSTRLSDSIVDQQQNLDTFLLSAIGLADVGNDVIGSNEQGLADVVHLLAPTTDLLNKYHEAAWCGISGLIPLAKAPPLPVPGAIVDASFLLGSDRYRFPSNLPKVAAKGGPQCTGLPRVPFQGRPPYVVADTGANPWQYGNQGILLNSDGLKQLLFGPIDGPPRNAPQIGQPG